MAVEYYQAFVNEIENKKLRDSINNIKQTASSIWTKEVRIIKDYTDHGPEHSERIFEKLYKILWPDNAIKLLSENELYLLILGIILHDIGMQCDIKKFPEIKTVAVNEYGASFQLDFSKGTASSYSKDEQDELRKNHHLLTAAWLDCIFRRIDTILPTISLESVPVVLRNDLIDVCRFHSKLNILTCPEKNDLSNTRVRLIAALLRLGDELDIDRFRVDIDTVKLFGFGVENSLFWYLHEYTVVNIHNHIISLNILLNQDNYDSFADYFETEIIDEFNKKNRILAEIIMSYGITIGISLNSKVECVRFQKALPDEICAYLKPYDKKKDNSISGHSTKKKNSNYSQHSESASYKFPENDIPPEHIGPNINFKDFFSSFDVLTVADEIFTVDKMVRWESMLLSAYKSILDEILDTMDPACTIHTAMNISLLDDSIINAVLDLKKIVYSSNHKNEPNRIKKVAYIVYWFLRLKPIQIFCPRGEWIEDVFVKDSSKYSKEDFDKANNVLAWKIKHVNEYSALTFALFCIINYEKLTLSEQDYKTTVKGQSKRTQFNSIDEMIDTITNNLLYILSYKCFSPETLEYFLIGCTYLFPFALIDENMDR